MSGASAIPGLLAFLLAGAWLAATLDRAALAAASGDRISPALGAPLRDAAALLARPGADTERPDRVALSLAPALYIALAALGLALVPFAPGAAVIDSPAGIVLWGACESLAVVAVFLHGWGPNAPFPLLGAYRYVATGLPAMLVSMFVLIGAALPAQSLSVIEIVESQRDGWNVIRQPLGLPLFLVLILSLSLRGPMDYADGEEIAGGTTAEASGGARAAWGLARLCILVSGAAMGAAAFLGGPLGPWLPGWVWLALKTAGLLVLLTLAGRLLARTPPAGMVQLLWLVLLPLAFLDLVWAGGAALW